MDVGRIDLERARREAKALLAAARAGDDAARTRIGTARDELQLAAAQLAIARELGERSWPALVLGDPVPVDPLVPLEPLGWLPLVYVAHSGYLGGDRTDALVASAERLLDGGADPGGAYVDPEFGAQSALYGAAGRAHEPRLTRLLLDRGASPDDRESLYHATETPDHACVRLLLEAGATVAGTNALAHALDREDPELVELLLAHGPARGEPWPELARAIPWAISRNRSLRAVELLAAHGAAADRHDRRTGRTPYAAAVARGRTDIADLLVRLGAAPEASELDELLGACQRGDREAALARAARDPALVPANREALGRALVSAAGEGRVEATALLCDIGAPIDAIGGDLPGTGLHHAVWNGQQGAVELLLRRGADPVAVAPPPTSSTPLAWAVHGSRYGDAGAEAYLAVAERLVAAGAARDPALADDAAGSLADWLADGSSA